MLMSKVMVGKARAVESIVSGKGMLQFEGRAIESMKAVANAYKERSLHALDKVLVDFKGGLDRRVCAILVATLRVILTWTVFQYIMCIRRTSGKQVCQPAPWNAFGNVVRGKFDPSDRTFL